MTHDNKRYYITSYTCFNLQLKMRDMLFGCCDCPFTLALGGVLSKIKWYLSLTLEQNHKYYTMHYTCNLSWHRTVAWYKQHSVLVLWHRTWPVNTFSMSSGGQAIINAWGTCNIYNDVQSVPELLLWQWLMTILPGVHPVFLLWFTAALLVCTQNHALQIVTLPSLNIMMKTMAAAQTF